MKKFELGNEMWKWIDQHDTSVEQRKNLKPRQELNPWPPDHNLERQPGVPEVMGWIPVLDSDFFFLEYHVDPLSFMNWAVL